MSRVNQAQMKKLLDLLSEDGVLVDGRVMYTNTNKQNFWKRIAMQLNAVEGGVYKNTWKWCKMWADWKNKTKKKANILLSRKSYGMEQPTPTLTTLELRLLKMINYPIADKDDALALEMVVSKEEVPEPDEMRSDEFQTEFLNNDYGDGDMLKEKTTSEEDEEKVLDCYDTVESKFCDVDDIIQDEKLEEEVQDEESSDYTQKVNLRVSEKVFKKRKVSLEEYKVRTTLKIEKERVQQKSEELRLRAIELKLKGEELRLKEIEMNKINYLTGIEEEKLKCFRDISSSLKELSERTRNGLRYHNGL
uniref:Regulatory protein zeste n=1 Tax=Heliothis virescens TaxID=7102 RepID=A0A2A4JEN8_HELVI